MGKGYAQHWQMNFYNKLQNCSGLKYKLKQNTVMKSSDRDYNKVQVIIIILISILISSSNSTIITNILTTARHQVIPCTSETLMTSFSSSISYSETKV